MISVAAAGIALISWNRLEIPEDVSEKIGTGKIWIGSMRHLTSLRSQWMRPWTLELPWNSLHDNSRNALYNLPFALCENPVHIEMHVDGGAAKGEAVWAAIALWYDGQQWFYGGSKGDHVRTDCNDIEHHGADTLSANTAEVSALTWAMLFVLQFDPSSCSIYYDSEFSAQSTQGL